MEIPSINLGRGILPRALDMPSIPLKQPTAEMPVFPPIVIPPSNLEAPEGVELEENKDEETTQTEQPSLRVPVIKIDLPLPTAEVVATATYAAVAAVATTTLATPFFNKIKKQVQKFLQKKVDKWKENRQKKKGVFGKLKDAAEDQEQQIQILGTFVRLGVVVWSGFIITMNYVEIPMVKKSGNSDITFVASVFTGALATFGLTTGNNNKNKTPVNCPMVKKKEE